jgi:hypothetical protein
MTQDEKVKEFLEKPGAKIKKKKQRLLLGHCHELWFF